jgi:hypothetical protein
LEQSCPEGQAIPILSSDTIVVDPQIDLGTVQTMSDRRDLKRFVERRTTSDDRTFSSNGPAPVVGRFSRAESDQPLDPSKGALQFRRQQ